MRRLFFAYAGSTALMMWAALAGGGNANHGGSWIAALIGMIICQPWMMPLAKAFALPGDWSPLTLGLSSGINLILLGIAAFWPRKKEADAKS